MVKILGSIAVLSLLVLAGFAADRASTPPLVALYAKTAPKIVSVSPYQQPAHEADDIIMAKVLRRKLTPKFFRADYSGGSGILIRKDGLILTANHVVKTSSLAKIESPTGTYYKAVVLARNKDKDLALLQIVNPQEEFSVVEVGKPRALGWPVYTIGNPAWFTRAVTAGVLTARDYVDNRLVSDAFVEHGSSGGGLFDATNGELLGVVVQLYKAYSASIDTADTIEFISVYSCLAKT